MSTKVWGSSDDNICFDGDVYGEVSKYGTDDAEQGVILFFSDGTVVESKYGKDAKGIWGMRVLERGTLFDRVDLCTDEDAKPYSDVVHFCDGLKYAYAGTARVRTVPLAVHRRAVDDHAPPWHGGGGADLIGRSE